MAADGTVAITAGTGTPIRVITGAGPNGADQQVVTLADSAGNLLGGASAPLPVSAAVVSSADPDTVQITALTVSDVAVAAPTGNGALLTGTPTPGSYVQVTCPGGDSSWDVQLSNTIGGGTVYFEASFDGGSTWLPVNGRQTGIVNTVLGYSTTTLGAWRGNTSGASHIRVRLLGASSPNLSVVVRIASGVGAVFLNASIPAGTNTIGSVKLTDGTNTPAVKGSSATAIAGDSSLVVAMSPNTPLPPGNNNIGSVTLAGGSNNGVGNVGHAATGVVSGNITALNGSIDGTTDLTNYLSVRVQVTGTWVGTLSFQVSADGTNWFTKALTSSVGAPETSQSVNGIHSGATGARYFRVIATYFQSGTAAVIVAYTAAADSSAGPLSNPDGTLLADTGGSTIYWESFDTGSSNYILQGGIGGTSSPSPSNGVMTFQSATTASASSYQFSNTAVYIAPPAQGYLRTQHILQLDTVATLANNTRFWGYGIVASGPTAAAPIQSGVVFMTDYTTGAFIGAVYNAATRTKTVSLTKPTDGAYHKYEIMISRSVAYFLIDGTFVGQITFPTVSVAVSGNVIIGSFNHTTGPASAPTMLMTLAAASDSSKSGSALVDGVFPWKRATVRVAQAPSSSDNALTVGIHPSSSLPSGSANIGSVNIAQMTDPLSGANVLTSSDVSVAAPTGNGAFLTGTPSTNSYAPFTIGQFVAYPTLDVQCTGTFGGGTVYFEVSMDNTNWVTITGIPVGTVAATPTYSATATGVWRFSVAGFTYFRARILGATSPSVTVTAQRSSAPGPMSLTNGGSTWADGSLNVNPPDHAVFLDTFDSNANGGSIWNVLGTVTPTWSAGTETLPLTTTISATSYMQTTTAVAPLFSGSFIKATFTLSHEATATTNNTRFWGLGIWAGSPTAAAPLTNGVGFQLDPTTGGLLGVAWSAGVRTQTVSLVRQTDGGLHRYSVYFRTSRAYFEIDGTVVGSMAYPNLAQSQSLKLLIGSFNGTSAASQATTFSISGAGITDTSSNAVALMDGDPTTGFRRATIKAASTPAQGGDTALVVALSPNNGLAAGTNAIGTVGINALPGSGNQSGSITATDAVVGVPTGTGVPVSTTPTANSAAQYNIGAGNGTGYSNLDIQLTGTFGSGTIYFEGSQDQTNWIPMQVTRLGVLSPRTQYATTTAGVFRTNPGAFQMVRARIVGATSPAVTVLFRAGFQPASNTPSTLPGGQSFSLTSAASTNATAVRTIPTALYELTASNPTATAAYLKLYDKASAPTVGTDVPIMTIRLAATGSAGDYVTLNLGATGKAFANGFALALTAAAVATDTAIAVAGVQIHGTTA